jgi:hypothetical protein
VPTVALCSEEALTVETVHAAKLKEKRSKSNNNQAKKNLFFILITS